MKKVVPQNAHLIPPEARKVFSGIIYDVYQWPQTMFDGTTETFEMLKRADTVSVFPVRDDKLVVLKQLQPGWTAPKYGFPGGRIDPEDTSLLEAVKRETREETGLSFRTWKLVSAQQREEKLEWFHYKYVATDFETESPVHHDPGEQIEVLYMTLDEVKELAKREPRMGQGIIEKVNSIQELINLPEYMGKEIDV
jgi:8-oxo-dGTP pyrophosphatase MutT (NUDIX family)